MATNDLLGRRIYNSDDLIKIIYKNPDLDISKFTMEDGDLYVRANDIFNTNLPVPKCTNELDDILSNKEEFDTQQQKNWYMPEEYKALDIAEYILGLCESQEELQRVGEELLLYQERELFDLLRYLKYMVDTFRKNNILWGVGRGSSVASYVLYLLGVHRINSLYYDLDIKQFLR